MQITKPLRLLSIEAKAQSIWNNLSKTERAAFAALFPMGRFVEQGDASPSDLWWNRLSRDEQEDYVKAHPRSKFANKIKFEHRGPAKPVGPQIPQQPKNGLEQPDGKTKSSPRTALTPAPENPEHWPEHIRALKLPPAWTNVQINMDPNADLQAIGTDSKSRQQYVYSEKFAKSQAALKFARIDEMRKDVPEIAKQISLAQGNPDPVVKDHGDCSRLVFEMGVQPGSDDDTGADTKAYGASTLEGRHVVDEDGKTYLKFIGKKGVALNLPVDDPDSGEMLRKRAQNVGANGKLFPHVTNRSLSDYVHSLAGGGYKTKDMRTLKGTSEAYELVNSLPAPKNMKEYKKAVRAVAIHVSKKLGNTPTVALASYIHPAAFGKWQANLPSDDQSGNKEEAALKIPVKPAKYIMLHPTSIHASHPTSTTPKIHRTSTAKDETGTKWHVFTHGSKGKKPNAFARIAEQPEGMHLDLIKTHPKMKGKGIASKLMKHINRWADRKQKPIFLDREPQDSSTNDKRLKHFYEKHDFVSHPKKDKLMMRLPKEHIEKSSIENAATSDLAINRAVKGDSWWLKMSSDEQKQYLSDHPQSHFKYGGHGIHPLNPEFQDAIAKTKGAQSSPDGLHLKVTRFQKPSQAGDQSVRDGVFFIPHDDAKKFKDYRQSKNQTDAQTWFGGKQHLSGSAHLKKPMIVKASTGGSAPEAAYAAIKGKIDTEAMINACRHCRRLNGLSNDERIDTIRDVLQMYGGNEGLAEHIYNNSKQGNQLNYAMQENIVANTLKKHGYDSLLAYNKAGWGGKGHHLTELFDLRHNHYPKPGEELASYPNRAWVRWKFRHPKKEEPASFSKYTEQASTDRYLRTAIKHKGTIYVGHQGEAHGDIAGRYLKGTKFVGPKYEHGFINHKSQWMPEEHPNTVQYVKDNSLGNRYFGHFSTYVYSDMVKKRKFPKDRIIKTETPKKETAAQGNDWWNSLSRNQQLEYIRHHPHTHRKVTKQRKGINTDINTAPKPQKNVGPPLNHENIAPKSPVVPEPLPAVSYKDFAAVNEYLRGDRSPAAGSDAENEKLIKSLDRLIASHTLSHDVIAWRGYGDADITKSLHDPAYLSLSLSETVAREHAGGNGYIARVAIPAGTNAYEYKDDHQQEIVLPRLTRLHMRGVNHIKRFYALSLDPKSNISTASDAFLRTAVKHQGKIYVGDQGEKHDDIKVKSGIPYGQGKHGFINHKNTFMSTTHPDVSNYAQENGLIDQKYLDSTKHGIVVSDFLKPRKFTNPKIISTETASLEIASDAFLRTAIKHQGKIYAGHQGELHSLLEKRHKIASGEDGFLNHKNQFLNRQKAVKYAADNGIMPKKHLSLIRGQGGMISDILDDRRFNDKVINTEKALIREYTHD